MDYAEMVSQIMAAEQGAKVLAEAFRRLTVYMSVIRK